MFDPDNMFLVDTFEAIVATLPTELIAEAQQNGSYYNFHIKTKDVIMVPRAINFAFKHLHLIKQHSPEYWEHVIRSWNSIVTPDFGDPLEPVKREGMIRTFEDVYYNDPYGIMPPVVQLTDDFIIFQNLEEIAKPLEMGVLAAHKISQLYQNVVTHQWNDTTTLYVFPVNNTSFYGTIDGKLVLVYPVWDAYRWSFEIPKFICDTRHLSKIIKFKPFDINQEQESIRRMNGAPDKKLFQ